MFCHNNKKVTNTYSSQKYGLYAHPVTFELTKAKNFKDQYDS